MSDAKDHAVGPVEEEKNDLPDYSASQHSDEKKERKGSVVSAEIICGDVFDERYERTKRGTSLQA